VLVDGRARQTGTPAELVAAPGDAFVASFTGGNLMPGMARPRALGGTVVALRAGGALLSTDHASGPVGVAVYPWEVELCPPGLEGPDVVQRRVTAVTPEGGRLRVRLEDLAAECPADHGAALALARGRLVGVRVPPAHARLLALDAPPEIDEGGR
jgi:ABC-type sulfate/molybdate transport systems ATPase subunit